MAIFEEGKEEARNDARSEAKKGSIRNDPVCKEEIE